MHILSPIAYVLAGVGVGGALTFAGLIIWDVFIAEAGKETISQWFIAASTTKKVLVLSIVFAWSLIFGGLLAHLVWAKDGSNTFWILSLVVAAFGFLIGGWIGNHFFGQTEAQLRLRGAPPDVD
jgi:hypothetical protein